MPIDSSTIRTLGYQDPATGRQITRLQFRSWFVDVDGTAISVPRQRITAAHSPIDLDICLNAARHLVRQNTPSPAPTPPPTLDAAEAVAAVLQAAHDIASTQWHPVNLDVYACTSAAWTNSGMTVAYTSLIRALRRALPPGGSRLIDVNDNAATTRDDICDLYRRAIDTAHSTTAAVRGVA
jgi:hypothetical protein